MAPRQRVRLTAEDWTAAAVTALADGGLAAVAIEPLAARLGTTKGSFYWHFTNRDALLTAALERWERTDTEDAITEVAGLPAGREQLRALVVGAARDLDSAGARAELTLLATARHPLVAPVLARVARRRIDYLAEQFVALGFAPDEAARRGQLAYAAYLGAAQLAHATPADTDLSDAYLDTTLTALTARP